MLGRKNKKGSLADISMIGVVLLFLSILLLVGFKVTSELNDRFQASPIPDAKGKASSAQLTDYYPGVIDNTFLFFAVGLAMVTLMLAAMVRVHPIFIPFFFIGLIVLIFLTGIFSNIYQEMAADSNLAGYAAELTFTTTLMENLPLIVGVFGILLMIVMYKLWSVQTE